MGGSPQAMGGIEQRQHWVGGGEQGLRENHCAARGGHLSHLCSGVWLRLGPIK